MFLTARFRTALLTGVLVGSTLIAPLASAAPSAEFDGIPFENPSAVTTTLLEATATPGAELAEGTATPVIQEAHGAYWGDPEAPVTVQLYADYQCPHCRNFHNTIEPTLIENFIRPGHIRLELIDFPVIGIKSLDELADDSKESVQAAEATMCAGEQDAFMDFRETLYEGSLAPNSGALSDENLIAVANDLGLDGDGFSSCLASGRYEQAVIDGSMAGREMGVKGTPTLMVNGETLQFSSLDDLELLLNQAIEQAG